MDTPIGHYGGYRKLFSFGYVCLVYHATVKFCKRECAWPKDPLGKTAGQMIGAARSAKQNIIEGSTRAGTSSATELNLLDVSRGSLEELKGDYEDFLGDLDQAAWSIHDARYKEFAELKMHEFDCSGGDVDHRFGLHMLEMRKLFAPWLENEDPQIAANTILMTITRANRLLTRQIEALVSRFGEEGGMHERMTAFRLEKRDQQQTSAREDKPPAPQCPKCTKLMVLRKRKADGKPFWACPDREGCNTIVNCEG